MNKIRVTMIVIITMMIRDNAIKTMIRQQQNQQHSFIIRGTISVSATEIEIKEERKKER